jgi:hypothetical protein
MVVVAMGQDNVRTAIGDMFDASLKFRIARQERVDQQNLASGLNAKA